MTRALYPVPVPDGLSDTARTAPEAARRFSPAPAAGSPPPGDETRARAIARAVWTEIHWLMPPGREVTITVDGDFIDVAFGPHLRLVHPKSGPDRERSPT